MDKEVQDRLIKLTPEEVKALHAYIYGRIFPQEEYRLGAEIHDKVFGVVEKEIEDKNAEAVKSVLVDM